MHKECLELADPGCGMSQGLSQATAKQVEQGLAFAEYIAEPASALKVRVDKAAVQAEGHIAAAEVCQSLFWTAISRKKIPRRTHLWHVRIWLSHEAIARRYWRLICLLLRRE
jgi:hypothetical protein